MLKHETELLEDKGFNYRNKITALISLSATHYTSVEVSQIMHLTYRQLCSLMKQNPRLPKPYDWKEHFSSEELKAFYHKGMKTKYDNLINPQSANLDLSETKQNNGNIDIDKTQNDNDDVIFGDEKDEYLRELLHGLNQ